MSAQQMPAAVTYLEAVPTAAPPAFTHDAAPADLTRELETERSAGKAMLAAVKELDSRLAQQRGLTGELQERLRAAEAQLVEYASALTMQVSDNHRLRRETRAADGRPTDKPDVPAWRRLFSR